MCAKFGLFALTFTSPAATMSIPDLPLQSHDENLSDRHDSSYDTAINYESDASTSEPSEPGDDELLSNMVSAGVPEEGERSAEADDEWEALLDEYEQGFEVKMLHDPGMLHSSGGI
jgi:hypothetical protein